MSFLSVLPAGMCEMHVCMLHECVIILSGKTREWGPQ